MREVGILFAGIFMTILPLLAILEAGVSGSMGGLIGMVNDANGRPIDWAYFTICGTLSAFLDNAPTYLVFFNAAGGDPVMLMGAKATTLIAISAGAAFWGGVTYIGNARTHGQEHFRATSRQNAEFSRLHGLVGSHSLPSLGLTAWVFFR